MTKAHCQHGRPWYGPCLNCDWCQPLRVPEIPFWASYSPAEAQRVAEAIMADAYVILDAAAEVSV